jgi:ribosomal protein S18 acetylase RimI-like enzyme
MGLTYFKRYRMEIELTERQFAPVPLPEGFRMIPWSDALLEIHAETKFLAFRSEIDSNVFPCLGEQAGCLRLMQEIRQKPGFLPEATWLIARDTVDGEEYCGTIQGIIDRSGMGAVQNLGIVPEHRGHGLGSALMRQLLDGFKRVGLERVFLEVTCQNEGAIRLYRRFGFRKARTIYKVVEVAYS